jgi:hypothetical protein
MNVPKKLRREKWEEFDEGNPKNKKNGIENLIASFDLYSQLILEVHCFESTMQVNFMLQQE